MSDQPLASLPEIRAQIDPDEQEVTISVFYYHGATREESKEIIKNVRGYSEAQILSAVKTASEWAEKGFYMGLGDQSKED